MTKIQNSKPVYDLEERIFQFAKAVRLFVKTVPKTIANIEMTSILVVTFWSLNIVIWKLFVIWCLLFGI